jgi:mannose/cellobiose epimerase-like protein (N-acyl-D-glucosamine 2-epimerase family)
MSTPRIKTDLAEQDLMLWSQAFRAWMFDKALPYWSERGLDGAGRGFCEHLRLDGAGAHVPYKRLRVQARQIYVFSHAALLGWSRGTDVAERGYDFICSHALLSTGAWARKLGRHGGVLDTTADLYDLAFVLFALAWYARASGRKEVLGHAEETLDRIEKEMAHPLGGFYQTLPVESGPRLQNPHMHLLEALLALYETSADRRYLRSAGTIVALFRKHFFDASSGSLGEFFNEDLSASPGAAGDHVEPGHHYEWVWLLTEYSKASGESTLVEQRALYRFAEAHGVERNTGAIVDIVGRDGRVRSSSCRLWPQAEAIKAHIVMLPEDRNAAARLAQCLANLIGRHFGDCPPGTWREHFDADGNCLMDKIPSSSFYHVFMAFGEIQRSLP